MEFAHLVAELPLERRLALAYAPARARPATLALFALDGALGRVVRSTRETMLGQLRLAWWREALARPIDQQPQGEPVLAALRAFGDERAGLECLVDGWEALLGDAPLPEERFAAFAAGRGEACSLLAKVLDEDKSAESARLAGSAWALAELAPRLSDPLEGDCAARLIASHNWTGVALPRSLRPLKLLHGLALRSKGERPLLDRRRDILVAFRLGLLGV
jgi:phytoene synthase